MRLCAGLAALLCLLCAPAAAGAGLRAGVGRVDITPDGPIWLSGYVARTHASSGILTRLWAKALAFEDDKGNRAVIVATDLIGLPRSITDIVAARLAKTYDLDRSRILFNSSHTHTGPFVKANLVMMFEFSPEDDAVLEAYAERLRAALYDAAAAALGDLAPAEVAYGAGEAPFAINRRTKGGPVDHSVPVLRVVAKGRLKAALFGYACHNTTMTAQNYQIGGDYAAFAQMDIESANPGSTALFIELCGGDQNPEPRGTPELAERHGKTLAAEVRRILETRMAPVNGRLSTAYQLTDLDFAFHTRETFEAQLSSKIPAERRRAQAMLKAYDERQPVRRTPYPVQAIRFENGPTILALGGEVVVDYDLRAKQEYAGPLIVAGYSNDVMCYIPSVRVLREGGYEANESMIYYGQPGPFADTVEEKVFDTVHSVMKRVGAKKAKKR